MRTLAWEGIEFGNFILIATMHLWNQSIENSMSSSPLGCDFVTLLILLSLIKDKSQTKQSKFAIHILIIDVVMTLDLIMKFND